jgi:hypothetical protein
LFKQTKLVCLSPHLREGAGGHFYQYHKSLYLEFSQNFDTTYVGLDSQPTPPNNAWFLTLLPESLEKPVPRVTASKLLQIIERATGTNSPKCIFYVFEGSLYWLLLGLKIIFRKPESVIVINQFKSAKAIRRLTGNYKFFWSFIYQKVLEAGRGRILISADNQKFFRKLCEIFPNEYVKYIPIIPSLPQDFHVKKNRKRILIVVRGKKGRNLLRDLAPSLAGIDDIIVHGLGREDLDAFGLSHVSISGGNLDSIEYSDSYKEMDKCLFLYDNPDFEYQSSARFVDSHFAGVPVMVSKKNAMAHEFEGCTLVSTFEDGNISTIIDFFEHKAHRSVHYCQNEINRATLELSTIQVASLNYSCGLLAIPIITKFLVSVVLSFQYFISFCTLGGTINPKAIKDKVRRFLESWSL